MSTNIVQTHATKLMTKRAPANPQSTSHDVSFLRRICTVEHMVILSCCMPCAILTVSILFYTYVSFGIYERLVFSSAGIATIGLVPMLECSAHSIAFKINFGCAILSLIHASGCLLLIPIDILYLQQPAGDLPANMVKPSVFIPHFALFLILSFFWLEFSSFLVFRRFVFSSKRRNLARSLEKIRKARERLLEVEQLEMYEFRS